MVSSRLRPFLLFIIALFLLTLAPKDVLLVAQGELTAEVPVETPVVTPTWTEAPTLTPFPSDAPTETSTEIATPTETETLAPSPAETELATSEVTEVLTSEPTTDVTLEPTEEQTAETTTLPTSTVIETPFETATSEVTVPPVFPSETPNASPTATAPAFPPEPELQVLFNDTFDIGELYLWTLGAGWSLVDSEGGKALQATNSDEPVTFVHNTLGDVAVEAQFALQQRHGTAECAPKRCGQLYRTAGRQWAGIALQSQSTAWFGQCAAECAQSVANPAGVGLE
jgi:hypothetical protein